MVEDNEIKAQVSPFAIREGEIKTFDGKDGYVSMNQIVHKINIGHINDIHFYIMEILMLLQTFLKQKKSLKKHVNMLKVMYTTEAM